MLIKNGEPKEPRYDHKAGKQIFSGEKKNLTLIVPKDTENPIDIRLRQLAMSLTGECDLRGEFIGKNICVMVGDINHMRLVRGKIKDLYPQTRDIRLRTRKGEDVIVGWGKVLEVSEREL